MKDLYGDFPPRVGELLEELGRRGVSLRVGRRGYPDRLNYWPKDKVPSELAEELKSYKPQIIEVVRWDEERKARGEGCVRDTLEVVERARQKFGEPA